jgi:hypothetical protein
MKKYFYTIIISTVAVAFIIGCAVGPDQPQQVPEPTETPAEAAETPKQTPLSSPVEPPYIEPDKLQPDPPAIEPPPEPNDANESMPENEQTKDISQPEPNEPDDIIDSPAAMAESANEPDMNDIPPAPAEPCRPQEPDLPTPATEPNKPQQPSRPVEPNAPEEPNQPQISPAEKLNNTCESILSEYVDENGLVDYEGLRRRRGKLFNALDKFDEFDRDIYKSFSREQKMAFWINAYNMELLGIIARNYPIEGPRILNIFWGPYSIRHLGNIWQEKKFIIMDEQFTLTEIENRYFREEFDDPRAFLALSRASLSGPPLRNTPYRADKLDQQLEDQSSRYIKSPYGLRIDRDAGVVSLSPIFQAKQSWFGQEFLDKYGTELKFKQLAPVKTAVLNFMLNYVDPQNVSYLETANYTVDYMGYDWTLNYQGADISQ